MQASRYFSISIILVLCFSILAISVCAKTRIGGWTTVIKVNESGRVLVEESIQVVLEEEVKALVIQTMGRPTKVEAVTFLGTPEHNVSDDKIVISMRGFGRGEHHLRVRYSLEDILGFSFSENKIAWDLKLRDFEIILKNGSREKPATSNGELKIVIPELYEVSEARPEPWRIIRQFGTVSLVYTNIPREFLARIEATRSKKGARLIVYPLDVPREAREGDVIGITVLLENTGDTPARDIILKLEASQALEIVGKSEKTIQEIPPGARETVSFYARVREGFLGEFPLRVEVLYGDRRMVKEATIRIVKKSLNTRVIIASLILVLAVIAGSLALRRK